MCWDHDTDDDYDDQRECDHDDAVLDILTGRMHCYDCGETWWASDAEKEFERKIRCEEI